MSGNPKDLKRSLGFCFVPLVIGADSHESAANVSTPYSNKYYERLKEDSASSAKVMVPIIMHLFHPSSVVDVGCGSGTWARAYSDAGARIIGVDGFEVSTEQLLIPSDRFERRDLSKSLELGKRFDLANCLEVAEHLDESRAAGFVVDLCNLSDVIVFSAAVPGQGGTHHVNEQWPSYWIQKFESEGYVPLDCLRNQVWQNPNVAWWYVQNAFAFVKRSRLPDFPLAREAVRPWPNDLVHPRAYVRATVPSEMSPRMIKEVVKALPHFPGKIADFMRR